MNEIQPKNKKNELVIMFQENAKHYDSPRTKHLFDDIIKFSNHIKKIAENFANKNMQDLERQEHINYMNTELAELINNLEMEFSSYPDEVTSQQINDYKALLSVPLELISKTH